MDFTTEYRNSTSHPVIGMFINWLVELHQWQWLGAVDAARAYQANLICFSGKELGHPDHFYAQASVIFDLVSAEHLDGLIIWTTTLQPFVGQQAMEAFCRRYQPLPMVSVEQVMPGLSSLLVDEKQGMSAAISHLIEVHGYRRIAFIRGPTNHPGAHERYQGYLDALARHGLPFDPHLVAPPLRFWRPEEAAAMIDQLLDQHIAVEAVATANDDLALGVLWALQRRRIRVPADIAVVGFDDVLNIGRPDVGMDIARNDLADADHARLINSRTVTLPLTTVRSPFYETGWRSVEVMLARLRGENVPAVVTIPTKVIVRRSCGCFSPLVHELAEEPAARLPAERAAGKGLTIAGLPRREQIIAQLRQAMELSPTALAPDWADRLATAFIRDLQGQSANAFLLVLDELVRASARTAEDLARWWPVLFVLRRKVLPYLPTGDVQVRSEDLWQQTLVLMWELAERYYKYQQALAEKRDQIVREIGQKLITTLDLSQLAELIAQEMPNLGVPSCYVALYAAQPQDARDQPAGVVEAASYPTEWARAILVYEHNQRIDVAAGEELFPSRQLVPGARLRRAQLYSMVVVPLYFQDQQLGFVLFEVGLREGWVYEALRGQLSSAVKGALLVEQTQEKNRLLQLEIGQRQQAEAALQKAHDELEHRVAERTAELAQANATLKAQISERERAEAAQAQLEAQLRQAQKMEAIGRLAGGIAHDFNNLLVVITGYSDLLLDALNAGIPVAKEDVEQIQQAGERAAALTRQLLAFSRKQVLQPRVLSLNAVVANIELMLQRLIGEDIKLLTNLEPTLAAVTADPGQLEQIILNLAVNARDAMPHGGHLTIETSNVYLDADYARQHVGVQRGRYVLLRVSDTGTGMDAETQARVFEPFFSTKPQGKGTGLGLATVFGIVQQSGGHIDVASEIGQGTTFTIYLPEAEQRVEEAQVGGKPSRSALAGVETILLVEDDAGVRAATHRFLEAYGYTVLEAAQGMEALRLCQQHNGPIHLVITDVVMPHMSGRELVEQLASLRPEMPVLYVSGYTDSAMIRHGVSEATISLLQKPFTADALAHTVRELLDRQPKI